MLNSGLTGISYTETDCHALRLFYRNIYKIVSSPVDIATPPGVRFSRLMSKDPILRVL